MQDGKMVGRYQLESHECSHGPSNYDPNKAYFVIRIGAAADSFEAAAYSACAEAFVSRVRDGQSCPFVDARVVSKHGKPVDSSKYYIMNLSDRWPWDTAGLQAYANACRDQYPVLAEDIESWLRDERQGPLEAYKS